ncbi:MAG: DUF2796 domain-containing protein [Paracoccaceae bacterium]|nr:DUF2796 domain-containing protein [Paracoccaceae bacterium]
MKSLSLLALLSLSASPVLGGETRQLDAHEHGVGQLDIAIEGTRIEMALHAPGADIVGFEYAARSAEDRAAVDAAVAILARPLDLFVLPGSAGCSVVAASAELESEAAEHEEHAGHEGEHGHDDHDEHAHDDEHGHDDEHAHEDHEEAAGHTEFHAEYQLNCADPAAISNIGFVYFETFPNALELEVQIITERGAQAFEVMKDAPTLDLRGMF